jgi:tripeptidyl-peptidase-1
VSHIAFFFIYLGHERVCRYGAHLSKESVAALVAPHPDTSELVSAWLEDHSIDADAVRPVLSGDWLMLSAVPISTANILLGASYEVYEHAQTGERLLRTTSYSLPSVLHGHVSTVSPTTYFGGPKPLRATHRISQVATTVAGATDDDLRSDATVPSSCASTITPACLKALYNTTGYTPQATDKNIIGVTGCVVRTRSNSNLSSSILGTSRNTPTSPT